MQNDPVTSLALFHNYLAAQDPSPATFDYLREQRLVGRATKNHVEHLLGDDNWRAPWLRRAHEFCNDLPAGTALVPGAPLNAGLERMIVNDEMSDLVTGMHEFRMDATTQERCIHQLYFMLNPYDVPGVHNAYHSLSHVFILSAHRTPGLFRCIVSAMRTHATNMLIQLEGCVLLTNILSKNVPRHGVPVVTRALADYTTATLIANVHQNMLTPALAYVVLDTMSYLVHMSIRATATGVTNPPFLMSGEHSIPGFLMTLMHTIQHDGLWVERSLRCLHILLVDAHLPQNRAELQTFNVGHAEEYILESMASSLPFREDGRAQFACMHALQRLYDIFPDRVSRPTDVMACVLQNLTAHSDIPEVRNMAINLMGTVIEGFWSRKAPIRVLGVEQSRPCVDAIMPPVVCSLRAANARDKFAKRNCITVFDILSTLCETHPPQIALLNQMQIVQMIHSKYKDAVEDAMRDAVEYGVEDAVEYAVEYAVEHSRWVAACARLKAILAGG